jgi:hypothetical protein
MGVSMGKKGTKMYRLLLLGVVILAIPAVALAADEPKADEKTTFEGWVVTPEGVRAQPVYVTNAAPSYTMLGLAVSESLVQAVFLVLIVAMQGLIVMQLSSLRAAVEAKK